MKKTLFFVFVGGMLFAQNQQVGINTDKPSATLHINGDMRIRDIIEGNVNEREGKINYNAVKTDIPLMWNEETHEVIEGRRSAQTPFYVERKYGSTSAPDRSEVTTAIDPYYYDIAVMGVSTVRKTQTGGADLDKLVMFNFTNYQVIGAPPEVKEGIMNPLVERIAPQKTSGANNQNWQATAKFVTGISVASDSNANLDYEAGYSDPQGTLRMDILGMQWEYVSLISLKDATTEQCEHTSDAKITYSDAGGDQSERGLCAVKNGVGGLTENPINNPKFTEREKTSNPSSVSKEYYWFTHNYSTNDNSN